MKINNLLIKENISQNFFKIGVVLIPSAISISSFLPAMKSWMGEKLFTKENISKEISLIDENFSEERLFFNEHHHSHNSVIASKQGLMQSHSIYNQIDQI